MKPSKKTLIERTLDKFSSPSGIIKNKKPQLQLKEGTKHPYGAYPVSPVDPRWLYQTQQYGYPQHHQYHHMHQYSPSVYDPHQQRHHVQQKGLKTTTGISNPGNIWNPKYSYSPDTPPVDYEFSYDRYRGPVCAHIDKYGTQRGSKYSSRIHNECKKCKSNDDILQSAYTRNGFRAFEEKHPILGSPHAPKYPYNYRYSRSDEEIDDEWNSYWDKEENEEPRKEESQVLPLQKLFLEPNEEDHKTKDTSDKANTGNKTNQPNIHSASSSQHDSNISSSKITKSSCLTKDSPISSFSGPKQNTNPYPKRPQLTTFASLNNSKESDTAKPFPQTGIIIVEDDKNIYTKVPKDSFERPFEEESTSSDSSTSSTDEDSTRNENIAQKEDIASDARASDDENITELNLENIQNSNNSLIKSTSAQSNLILTPLEDLTKEESAFTNESVISKEADIVDAFEVSKPKPTWNGQRRVNKLNNQKYYHRKYQSRGHRGRKKSPNTAIIDDVILEEDEDALEAENLEVISATPPIKVKSILKFANSSSTGGENDGSEISRQGNDNPDDKEIANDIDEVELAKKCINGVKECPKTHNGNETIDSTVESKHNDDIISDIEGNIFDANMKKFRRKGVTFNSFAKNFNNEKVDSVGNSIASNRSENGEVSSEDELQGYSTVIVSQNLTSEILEEIYGACDSNNAKDNETIGEVEEHPYETFPSMESNKTHTEKSKDSKRGPNFRIGDKTNKHSLASDIKLSSQSKAKTPFSGSLAPKSLADEILDEVYGSSPASNNTTRDEKCNKGAMEKCSQNEEHVEEGEYETIAEFRDVEECIDNTTKQSNTNMYGEEKIPRRSYSLNANHLGSKANEFNIKPESMKNPALVGKLYTNTY